jgi:hypothetical protein
MSWILHLSWMLACEFSFFLIEVSFSGDRSTTGSTTIDMDQSNAVKISTLPKFIIENSKSLLILQILLYNGKIPGH